VTSVGSSQECGPNFHNSLTAPGGMGRGPCFVELPPWCAQQLRAKAEAAGNQKARSIAIYAEDVTLPPTEALRSAPLVEAGEVECVLADVDAENGDGDFKVARHGPGLLAWMSPPLGAWNCEEHSIPF
jgi:hypothetical protein